jgi:hypothetical protein
VLAHLHHGLIFGLISLALVVSVPKQHRIEHCRKEPSPRKELVCAHRALRARRHDVRWIRSHRSPALYALTRRPATYWRGRVKFDRWRMRVDRRSIVLAHAWQARLRASTIAHRALWLCIHSREAGAWDTNTGNGYFGGLQMTAGWYGGPGHLASSDPAAVQMRAAEVQYRASGYSIAWLDGQWPNTAPPCLSLA